MDKQPIEKFKFKILTTNLIHVCLALSSLVHTGGVCGGLSDLDSFFFCNELT